MVGKCIAIFLRARLDPVLLARQPEMRALHSLIKSLLEAAAEPHALPAQIVLPLPRSHSARGYNKSGEDAVSVPPTRGTQIVSWT